MPESTGIRADCINHRGVEAVARCKQCNKAVCKSCLVVSAKGRFCSEACRDSYEEFFKRAQEAEARKGPSAKGAKALQFVGKILVLLLALVFIGAVLTFFDLVDIPMLSELVRKVLP